MASPKELHPGQRPGESLWDYLIRKRWEESQMRKLGISPSSYGLGSQEPTITDTVPERTKEKTVITQVDDPAIADKMVTTIEQAPSVTSDAEATSITEQALPVISNAEAVGKGLEKKQDESGMWWWVDSIGNFIGRVIEGGLAGQGEAWKHKAEAETLQAQAVVDTIGNLFDTTAERDVRMRQREFEQQGPMQDYQGALAGLMQPPAPQTYQPPPGRGDENLRDPAVLAYLTKQRKEAEVQQAEEDRIWGSYKYDIPSARKQYETDMAEIYKKAMQLSMFDIDPSAFVELATKRMEQTSTFDEQERLQKIQRGLYYTKDGKWDPPSSKRVAFNRAKKFGAGVKLASAISNFTPGKEKKEGAMQSFYKFIEGTGWKQETVRSGSDKADELAAAGYTVDRPYVDRGSTRMSAELKNAINSALEVGNIDAAIQAYIEEHTTKYDAYSGGVNIAKIKAAASDIVWQRLQYRYKDKVEMVDEMPPNDPEKLRLWEEDLRKREILYVRLPDGTIVDIVD